MDRQALPLTGSSTAAGPHLTLGQVLVAEQDLSPGQLRQALIEQAEGAERLTLSEVILRNGWVAEARLLRALAVSRGLEFIDDPSLQAEPGARAAVPESYRTDLRILPLSLRDGELRVCTSDPDDFYTLDALARETGLRVRACVATRSAIEAVLDATGEDEPADAKDEGKQAELIETMVEDFDESSIQVASHEATEIAGDAATSGPVVRLVNFMIASAVREGASDIHIEPDEGALRVRYRIDGTLFCKLVPPYRMHAAISSRVKIMARLDISERRVPQDGEISVRIDGKAIDLRVSTLPGKFGEKIVMRVIDRSTARLGLEKLGFREEMLVRFHKVIDEPHGVILVTGPTGSGKSTTLYSVLSGFDTNSMNVSTVEDPVECNLSGVHQVQTNVKAGMTFAGALRALLRQDPDILMVGEIRDTETAQVAVQAALTGHLVLSTLHTNDAPSATTRLVNLGVEPFLVAAALRGVLAQRLVRRVCSKCKEEYQPDAHVRAAMGKYGELAGRLWRGVGCPRCHQSGLAGRLGLYELFVPNEAQLDAITARVEPGAFRRLLEESGFESLWDDGMCKVIAGQTTIEEVHGACKR